MCYNNINILKNGGEGKMALVQCPNCGRKGVSDSIIGCPGCGYNIKRYFDNLSPEEKKSRELEFEKQKQELKQKREREAKEQLAKTKSQLQERKKKADRTLYLWLIPLLIGIFVLVGVFTLPFIYPNAEYKGLGWIALLALVDIFFSTANYVSSWHDGSKAIEDLHNLENGMAEYENGRKRRADAVLKQLEIDRGKRSLNHPVCPICGSNNTGRISTLNRGVSVAMTGFASSKIGKQWHCNNCKSNF